MMKYILFLLTEYYYEIACLRRKEILERAGAGGAVVTLQKLNLCSVEEACKRLSAKGVHRDFRGVCGDLGFADL